MAYMNQEKKAQIAPAVKAVLKKYGVKGTLGVRNHSTLVLNITSGPIQFSEDGKPVDVNPYWYHEHFSGKAVKFLKEIFSAMNAGNHDKSESQYDYFDVGWYVRVNVGQWNKPYVKI